MSTRPRSWRPSRAWSRGLRLKPACAVLSAIALVLWCVAPPAHAEAGAGKARQAPPSEKAAIEKPKAATPLPEQVKTRPLAGDYCDAVRDAAMEARYAVQAAHLETLAQRLDERLARLDTKSVELKDWLARRQAFIDHATEHLVGIFAAMRAEAASGLLARLDVGTAAAILSKLEARAASSILSGMPPDKASRLTTILASVARKSDASAKP